jgi:hypothetical protein
MGWTSLAYSKRLKSVTIRNIYVLPREHRNMEETEIDPVPRNLTMGVGHQCALVDESVLESMIA